MRLDLGDDLRNLELRTDAMFRPFFAFPMTTSLAGALVPPLDAFYRDHEMIVQLEIPRIDPEKVHVSMEQGVLIIRGERERREKVEGKDYVVAERMFGPFERRLAMPAGVDASLIRAETRDGVLQVGVPLPEATVPETRAIPVHAAEG